MTHLASDDALCRCLHPHGVPVDAPAVRPEPFCLTCLTLPIERRPVPEEHAFTALNTGPVIEAGTDPWDPYWWAVKPEASAPSETEAVPARK